MSRGGHRDGSGRKPTPPEQRRIRAQVVLDGTEYRWAKTFDDISAYVEELILTDIATGGTQPSRRHITGERHRIIVRLSPTALAWAQAYTSVSGYIATLIHNDIVGTSVCERTQ